MTAVRGAAAFFVLSALWMVSSAWAVEPKKPVSVYKVNPVTDGIVLGGTALLDIYPALNGYNFIHIRSSVNPDDLNAWDRQAIGNRNIFLDDLSDVEVTTAVAVPVIVDLLDVGWNHVLFEDMMVYLQTLTINTAFVSLFKFTTQRPIPRVYAGDSQVVNSHRGYEEFYSGHVSSTVAALSALALTLDLRHHSGIWPWVVADGYGLSVALERVAAGDHFPTGVLVGGVMGTAVGVLVPWLHKREKNDGPKIGLEPALDGAEVTWSRRF